MDSAVGDDLLEKFIDTNPRVSRMSNLQAAIGLLQLNHIDAFNEGARQNARILTENLGEVPGIKTPDAVEGDHIYVYYPLTVDADRRDDLRHHLLRNGFDTKTTDMSDCSALGPFQETDEPIDHGRPAKEASILEICVYPVISREKIRRLADAIRSWAAPA